MLLFIIFYKWHILSRKRRNRHNMIRNYILIAWRNLVRNKLVSSINILGLALGMTCCMLIMLWVYNERGMDGFHVNKKDLYQVYERHYNDGKVDADYLTQGLLAGELKRTVPEIKYASGLEYAAAPGTGNTFEAGGKTGKRMGFYAGNDFFSMFSYPLLQGNAGSSLISPSDIAVSHAMADYFFGGVSNAIGKIIRFDNKEDLLITAVFENVPGNSSMQFDFLRSWQAFVEHNSWVHGWGNTGEATFIQLQPTADPSAVANRIKDFIYNYLPRAKQSYVELDLQSFSKKYLRSSFTNGYPDGGRIQYVRLFTFIALFILIVGCINFMNLATAASVKRAKEVGLRKVIGAERPLLIVQFIGEAVMLAFLSAAVALMMSLALLPAFNALTGKHLSLPLDSLPFWAAFTGLTIATGFVAGSYPALFLSSMKPVRVLKGIIRFSGPAAYFRQGLVVFQFMLSTILIIGMIVVYRQMEYIQTKNIGYDRENLVYIPIEGNLVSRYDVFKTDALRLPGVINISKMRNSPTVIEHHTGGVAWPGKDPNQEISFADGVTGYDFVRTMKLAITAGRDFSPDYPADSTNFILNETAVAKIGYTDPIGRPLTWGNRHGRIIGVVKDFHFNSFHQPIDPLVLRLDENWGWGTILVRINGASTKEAITGLQRICSRVNPGFPFTYQFSDSEFAKLYESEMIVGKLTGYFAFVAIFISCLGLFGLAAFTTARRTREIGVRKVLGASVTEIIALLSKEFFKPVVIAIVLSFPLAWFVAHRWLEDFAYRIDVGWQTFAVAGLTAIGVALLTVSFQSMKAAMANPVNSLKDE